MNWYTVICIFNIQRRHKAVLGNQLQRSLISLHFEMVILYIFIEFFPSLESAWIFHFSFSEGKMLEINSSFFLEPFSPLKPQSHLRLCWIHVDFSNVVLVRYPELVYHLQLQWCSRYCLQNFIILSQFLPLLNMSSQFTCPEWFCLLYFTIVGICTEWAMFAFCFRYCIIFRVNIT